MRIAILDTVPEKYWHHDHNITDGEKFVDFLRPYLPGVELPIFYTARDELPCDMEAYDGYLLTGSPSSVNDNDLWIANLIDLVGSIIQKQLPLTGFCFGHQLIAKTLGGVVGKNEQGWNIGLVDLSITDYRTWMRPARSSSRLFHFNGERVIQLPSGARPYCVSDQYENFGFTIGDAVMTIQGHPEHPRRAMLNFVHHAEPVIGLETADLARDSLMSGEPDQPLWAEWAANFYLDAY